MKNKETDIRETMRKNIVIHRNGLGMRQVDLADAVGLKKNTIASWEQGLSSPDIDTIAKLLNLFDMDFYDFTGIHKIHHELKDPSAWDVNRLSSKDDDM